MIRLIYTSKISRDIDSNGVQDIITSARTYNKQAAVTGVLLSNFDCFFQVLEGPDILVKLLFQKIKRDPRHRNVRLMSESQVSGRLFPHWNMSYLMVPDETSSVISSDWTQLSANECETIIELVV